MAPVPGISAVGRRSASAVVVAACAALAVLAGPAHAAPGDLDASFGHGGIESLKFRSDVSGPMDVALRADGRILVSMALDNTPVATAAFAVARLLADGTLDTNFGHAGLAQATFTDFLNTPYAMALAADGRIVVAGNAESADGTVSEFAVARFLANGKLDRGFGQGGKVTTNFVGVHPGGVSNIATAVLPMPDGRLVVAGGASQCADCVHRTAIARYLAEGALDTTFGTNGLVDLPAIEAPNGLALLSNGHLLALNDTAVAEFDAAGVQVSVVSTTGGATIVAEHHTGNSGFLPDGRFLVAGVAQGPFGPHDVDIQCSRFLPVGNRDVPFLQPIFDFTGAPTGPQQEAPQAIAATADGRFVVGGLSVPGSGQTDFGVARLSADGSLDTQWGDGGTATTVIDDRPGLQFSFVSALALQADGRILAVGITGNHQGHTMLALARYLGD
jgi:uncharacterized delta-60 repeat protein